MSTTNTMHGAIAMLQINGKPTVLAKDLQVSVEGPLGAVEPVGQPHVEELLRLSSEVRFEFSIYRRDNASVTQQGFFPSDIDAEAFVNHPEMTVQIESTVSGRILHRITGFKAESVQVSYTKGEPSMYQISGRGLRHTDEANT